MKHDISHYLFFFQILKASFKSFICFYAIVGHEKFLTNRAFLLNMYYTIVYQFLCRQFKKKCKVELFVNPYFLLPLGKLFYFRACKMSFFT